MCWNFSPASASPATWSIRPATAHSGSAAPAAAVSTCSTIGSSAQYQGFATFGKAGTSTWSLTNTTTQATSWTINQGTLSISSDGNLGANTGSLTFNGGTLQFGASVNLSNSRAITLNAGGGTFDTNGFNTTLGQGIGGGGFTKVGAGTLTFSLSNSYAGGTTVSGGTLALSGSGNLGLNSNAVSVSGGTLDLGTFTIIQNGGVHLTGGTIQNGTLSSSGTFDLQAGTVSANLAGSGALTKSTTGTVILAGTDSYTGATTINAGTLEVDGSITGTSSVTINAGGALTGTGLVDPLTVTFASGATFAPGTVGVPGTSMTIAGNLVLQSGANYSVYVNPTTSSFAAVNGTATLDWRRCDGELLASRHLRVRNKYTILTPDHGRSRQHHLLLARPTSTSRPALPTASATMHD